MIMPLYVYRCVETGEEQELSMKISEVASADPGWDESINGGPTLHWRRVYTPPAVQFKGSGFYSTDNS
jgi:predicted nucleic acid-binding Zn ribbon protein